MDGLQDAQIPFSQTKGSIFSRLDWFRFVGVHGVNIRASSPLRQVPSSKEMPRITAGLVGSDDPISRWFFVENQPASRLL